MNKEIEEQKRHNDLLEQKLKQRKGDAKISISEYDDLKYKERRMYELEDRVKLIEGYIGFIIQHAIPVISGRVYSVEITTEEKLREDIICYYDACDQKLRVFIKEKP